MSDFKEQIFRLGDGVDVYNPDVTQADLKFKRLSNLQPYKGRLVSAKGFTQLTQLLFGEVAGFAFSTEPYSLYSSFYAFTSQGVHSYDFFSDEFFALAYTWPSGSAPVAFVSWYDRVYVSRKGAPIVRLLGPVATEVPNSPGARYMALSNNHLMVANLASGTQNYPNRIRWSDLYAPEDFEVREDSEADFFELEPGDGEITGLSYQRGNNLIYTRSSVWIARYNPLPTGYKFDPLYTDVGCAYHGSQVSVREKDYFIGSDNIYMIDGLQLVEIGDEIWDFFKQECTTNPSTGFIRTRVNKQEHTIAWIFDSALGDPSAPGAGYWSIVYNYKENKWSDRDPMGVFASIYFPYPLRGFTPIDDVSSIIDSAPNDTNLIDGDWQYPVGIFSEMHGGYDGRIFNDNLSRLRTGGLPLLCQIETYEFFAESLFNEKEFDVLCLHYAGEGRPNIKLFIGTRNNRLAPIVYSSAVEAWDQLEGETVFHFRNKGVGKLVRFKFSWENTATNYVTELTNLSLNKLDDGSNSTEK